MDLSLTAHDDAGDEISTDEAFSLYFRSDATDGWDSYDASKMLPRGDTWAVMAFKGVKGGEEVLKAQESRPYEDSVQTLDIELVQKNMPAARYTIAVQKWYSVPEEWSLRLRSEALDTTFVIEDANDTVQFDLGASSTTQTTSAPQGTTPKASTDTTHLSMSGEVGPYSRTLPVELAAFTGQIDGEHAVLHWRTLSETNNSGFAVQHLREADTQNERWNQIGFVRGQGTTNQSQSYEFTTSALEAGVHRFRLKQIDRSGAATLSAPVRIERKPQHPVSLETAPNPFTSQLEISITTRKSQTVKVEMFDLLGRRVREVGPRSVPALRRTQIQLSGHQLSTGTYLVRVKGETFSTTKKLSHVR